MPTPRAAPFPSHPHPHPHPDQGKNGAKSYLEKLNLETLTCREAVTEVAKILYSQVGVGVRVRVRVRARVRVRVRVGVGVGVRVS